MVDVLHELLFQITKCHIIVRESAYAYMYPESQFHFNCLLAVIVVASILCRFRTVPWVGLQCVIVAFPCLTHLFFSMRIFEITMITCASMIRMF